MPYYNTRGIQFLVNDANVLRDDDVVGRAFIDMEKIADMMRTGEPELLSLGENIGILKVVVTPLPADLKEKKGVFALTATVKQLALP